MTTFRVIGAGRAGLALERALVGAGWTALPVRHHGDDLTDAAAGCDLLVVAVPDAHVAAVAGRVAPSAATVVAHLAGSLGLTALDGHSRTAVLHPVVALSDPVVGAERLRGAAFATAGDPFVLDIVAALAGIAFPVGDAQRAAHHAACVIASNHTVALLAGVEHAAAVAGTPLAPYLALARGAVDLVEAHGTVAALPGPVARGDWATVAAHLGALPEADRPAYLALATNDVDAVEMAAKISDPELRGSFLENDVSVRQARELARRSGEWRVALA